MIKELILLNLSFLLSFILYPIWINFLYKFHIGERIKEEGPQTHLKKQGTPTMGGLVFVLVSITLCLIFLINKSTAVFIGFIVIPSAIFGLVEDLMKVYRRSKLQEALRASIGPIVTLSKATSKAYNKLLLPWDMFKEFWRVVGSKSDTGIQTYQKIFMQAAIAVLLAFWVYAKLGFSELWLPALGFINIGIFYPLFIFSFFIAVINAFNITDGLDGLEGGLSLIALCSFWVLAAILGYGDIAVFCAVLIGALISFLYFNIHPARMFMGNVGSFALGAAFAVISIILRREVILLVICAVFAIDGLSSIAQQLSVKIRGKGIFKMAPIHHHFEMVGWTETKITMRFWLAGIFFAFLGLLVGLL